MLNLGKGEGRSTWFLGDLHTFKAVSEDTSGAITSGRAGSNFTLIDKVVT